MLQSIDSIRLSEDVAMTLLIWLVQLIIYPAYHSIDQTLFTAWHRRYVKTIGYVVIPLMFAQVACISFQSLENVNTLRIAEWVLLLTAWLSTFTLSVPCHKKLKKNGKDDAVFRRLIQTNWIRTLAWTGVLILGLIRMALHWHLRTCVLRSVASYQSVANKFSEYEIKALVITCFTTKIHV
jgi:hypothetical protein